MRVTRYIADFDSSVAMLRATARYLHGQDFPLVGLAPAPVARVMSPLLSGVNRLPRRVREQLYILGGWKEAIPQDRVDDVDAEQLARWVTRQYPARRYPAVMVGASNGALVHLCAALGVPWLPQTFLVPVRHSGVHPDEPLDGLRQGLTPGARLLAANPDLQLHHMHDANQDRLMIGKMMYFRVKRRRLGAAYERFLAEALAEGGTIFIVDCRQSWPTVQVGERQYFQPGAVGGLTAEEYLAGSARLADYLARYGSRHRAWPAPEPDAERPEAEWGFEPLLADDIEAFARRQRLRVRRIVFDAPEDTSALVADFYREWYARHGMPTNRLLVDNFILMEPHWTLRTGCIPFWLTFNVESSADCLERYLDDAGPFEFIHLMLFSHGVESAGWAARERWEQVLRRATREGSLVGVDARRYPRDFATFARYQRDLRRLRPRFPIPPPVALSELDDFLARRRRAYEVRWEH